MPDVPTPSLTEESFKKYQQKLKPILGTAKIAVQTAYKDYESAVRLRQFKRCLFKKADEALAEYEGLLNGVVTTACQDAKNINNSVKGDATLTVPIIGYVDQATAINAAFKDVLTALRGSKTSLGAVEVSANAWAELIENSDQSEEKKWLLTHISGFEQYVKDIAGDPKTNSGLADQTNDLADDALEVAVKVAGINASINVDSLKGLTSTLETDCGALKDDIAGNITFTLKIKTDAQTNLSKQNEDQSTARAVIARARLTFAGLKNTESFIWNPGCLEGNELATYTRKELKELAKKTEQSFDQPFD